MKMGLQSDPKTETCKRLFNTTNYRLWEMCLFIPYCISSDLVHKKSSLNNSFVGEHLVIFGVEA